MIGIYFQSNSSLESCPNETAGCVTSGRSTEPANSLRCWRKHAQRDVTRLKQNNMMVYLKSFPRNCSLLTEQTNGELYQVIWHVSLSILKPQVERKAIGFRVNKCSNGRMTSVWYPNEFLAVVVLLIMLQGDQIHNSFVVLF